MSALAADPNGAAPMTVEGAVLIVDDTASKRLAMRSILEPLGYVVVEATSGEEALRTLMRRDFAVILLDVKMPEMDGYETAKLIRLRRESEHTPIIFVTSYAYDEAQIPLAYASGAVDFIFAPVTPAVLRAKVGIFVDMYRKSREVETSRQVAIDASSAKSQFVANMSHEMRTPLNGVLGMASLLHDTDLDQRQRGYVDALMISGEALLALIGDVLDFAKIEAGHLDLECIAFDLRDVVEEASDMLAEQAHAKGLELSVWVDAEVPDTVLGDRARLRQILLNLMSNAVKFTASGEVAVRVGSGRPGFLHFAVEDTGLGIDDDRASALFEAFVQADASTTREYGGTGLGLTISRQLVEEMGGEMGAGRRDGVGSVFWFTASLAATSDDPLHAPRPPRLRGVRTLVVDDNPTTRAITDYHLASWDMDCELVASVADALEAIDGAASSPRAFELVLLAVNLPDLAGAALIDALAGRSGEPPKLVLLTSAPLALDGAATNIVTALLRKPARAQALQEAIVGALSGASEPAQQSPVDRVAALDRGLLVLTAEDNEINRTVTEALLAKLGIQTAIAVNGREAVEMAAAHQYAAILMDCQMPILDGFGAAREIRAAEDGHRVPIIAMTALTMPGDRERCLDAGMDDYVSKPLRALELSDAIERWLPPAAPMPAGSVATVLT